ncbi:enoyl-CoA hydratase/isomerase [Mycobacteroides abscessus subsp. bolletii]|uniref:enoyl-CoA hydratase/isomerase family protein n=1 Tax=Mycobacteroides abscessus TaxID=36809 RepID=UPI0009C4A299|nr:enoyl-CoA hydratase/isomerase family protein [Mycobacteroides abscessus]SKG68536.1 enoyl-CoA hydratase/isomerase [Mycobacteroides abscessus subsp. bolletii]SKH13038.1 enoyl-CoA hydratase/isomerase [Mycobacteroides abscessus subsp. bolletii]
MTAATEVIEIEHTDRIAWVWMNRPPKNLLDVDLTAGLYRTLVDLDADETVGAIVLTGAGEFFCAGADGPKLRETGTAREFANVVVDLFAHFPRARKPILAAVNGDALAGGFGLVCSADVAIAVEGCRLGTIEASLGTWPMIAQSPVARRVPIKAALTNALTGVPFNADRARELGIVDEVVPADQLTERIRHYAELAMSGGAAALAGRALFLASADQPYDQALREGADAFVEMFGK